MADVRPILATHYDLDVVGPLNDVAAPPYDVIDTEQREELLARSPYNAVAIDLPKPYGETGPTETGDDPYERAARTIEEWREAGALVTDSEPAIWAMTQDYTGPDGEARTRHGILARVRVEDFETGQVLPHERTLPGPKKDRLDLTRATRHNLSAIFSLATAEPWPLVAPAIEGQEPWGEATDESGAVTRVWRVGDPEVHAAVHELLDRAQLLIADGHHRYETAIAYRDEVGGEGDQSYTLMALTGLDDPASPSSPPTACFGLAGDPDRQQALGNGLRELFDVTEVATESSTRSARRGSAYSASTTPTTAAASGCASRTRRSPPSTSSSPASPRPTAASTPRSSRRWSSRGSPGSAKTTSSPSAGSVTRRASRTPCLIEDGTYDVAFILRPIPVDQVKAICESDENMPPKSTYFFPKVMTGLVFNPVG